MSGPGRLELWEGGTRIAREPAPGSFDWWYFDADLSDGSALVVVFEIGQDYAANRPAYRVWGELVRPDGQRHRFAYSAGVAEVSAKRPEVRIGGSFLTGDLTAYRVFVDPSDTGGVGVDVTVRRVCPPRVSVGDQDNLLASPGVFGWVCLVPRGTLDGALSLRGRQVPVSGTGYHDKNWGTVPMGSLMDRWLWLRVVAGPYTVVFFAQWPTGSGGAAVHQVFVATAEAVLLNQSGPGAATLTARFPGAVADTPPTIAVEARQDGLRVTVQVQAVRALSVVDLARETDFLSVEEIMRAAGASPRPSYSRHVAEARVVVQAGDGRVDGHDGHGAVEFMDFHPGSV